MSDTPEPDGQVVATDEEWGLAHLDMRGRLAALEKLCSDADDVARQLTRLVQEIDDERHAVEELYAYIRDAGTRRP
jgi:hypothetical protein